MWFTLIFTTQSLFSNNKAAPNLREQQNTAAEQRLQYVRKTSYRICFTGMNITTQSRGWGWLHMQTGGCSFQQNPSRTQLCEIRSAIRIGVLVPVSVDACSLFWVAVRVTDTWTTWTFSKGWSGPRATSWWETERSSEIKQLHSCTWAWKVFWHLKSLSAEFCVCKHSVCLPWINSLCDDSKKPASINHWYYDSPWQPARKIPSLPHPARAGCSAACLRRVRMDLALGSIHSLKSEVAEGRCARAAH